MRLVAQTCWLPTAMGPKSGAKLPSVHVCREARLSELKPRRTNKLNAKLRPAFLLQEGIDCSSSSSENTVTRLLLHSTAPGLSIFNTFSKWNSIKISTHNILPKYSILGFRFRLSFPMEMHLKILGSFRCNTWEALFGYTSGRTCGGIAPYVQHECGSNWVFR